MESRKTSMLQGFSQPGIYDKRNECVVVDIASNDSHLKQETRENIEKLEEEVLKMDQIELKITHYFAKGLYAREMYIPANTILTGRVHKHEHINIISKGIITVLTDDGEKTITAGELGSTMVSKPGTKRAGLAHTDTVWTSIIATEETDIDKVVDLLTTATHEEYLLSMAPYGLIGEN